MTIHLQSGLAGTPHTTGRIVFDDASFAIESAEDGTIRVRSSQLSVCELHLFDGIGSAITPGIKLDVPFPFACTILGWVLVADQSGSLVVDLWKDSYANFPPTVADTITAAAKPTLSAALKNKADTVPTWSPLIAAGDVLRVNVDSAADVTRATLALTLLKT